MKKTKCPICRYAQTKELFKAKNQLGFISQFSIRKCLGCQIVFTYPLLDQQEMKKFYPKIYLWKEKYRTKSKFTQLIRKLEKKYFHYTYRYETKRLSKFIGKKGKILDVGCGTGLRLETFKKEGLNQCQGIEPLTKEAIYAKKVKKLPVEKKALNELNCPENSFDTITLYDVFEHLSDPIRHLKIIKKILKPQGWLVIKVPNFNSWQAKLFKDKWSALNVPLHCFHYTPKTIKHLLLENGFKIKTIDWKTNFVYPFSWVFSFPTKQPALIWQKEERGEQAIFYRIWWGLLLLFSVLPTLLETLFKKGGFVTIYAINQNKK